jgi:hypothetical protein
MSENGIDATKTTVRQTNHLLKLNTNGLHLSVESLESKSDSNNNDQLNSSCCDIEEGDCLKMHDMPTRAKAPIYGN